MQLTQNNHELTTSTNCSDKRVNKYYALFKNAFIGNDDVALNYHFSKNQSSYEVVWHGVDNDESSFI